MVDSMYASTWDTSEKKEAALSELGVTAAPIFLSLWGRDAHAHAPTTPDRLSKVLFRMGAPVVPLLIESLKSPVTDVRRGAADALFLHEAWGTSLSTSTHRDIAEALGSALRSASDPAGEYYLTALWSMDDRASPAASVFIQVIREHRRNMIFNAAQALENVGQDSVPYLAEVISSSDTTAQREAIFVLSMVRSPGGRRGNTSKVSSILMPLISESGDQTVVSSALLTLAHYGADMRESVPVFLLAAKWSNASVREAAIIALANIDGNRPEVITALEEALHDQERKPRCAAFGWLSVSKSKAAKNALKKIDVTAYTTGCAS